MANTDYQDKIVDHNTLVTLIEQSRQAGHSVVLCHGCFDIVHPGHLRYLEFARKHGDILVVSLTADAGISKESQRPYIPEELRAENLAALELVDLVYVDHHHTAANLIEAIRPDVYVKGAEYQNSNDPRFLKEQQLVEKFGGKVLFSSGEVVFSSTDLIRRMGRSAQEENRRLKYVCRRHDITMDRLNAILQHFGDKKVVVVGDVLIDRYVFCDAIGIANESPVMSLVQLDEHAYLGGAAVVARHLAGLHAEVVLLSSFGEDQQSRDAINLLGSAGIAVESISLRDHLVVKTRYLVEATKLMKVEQGTTAPLETQKLRKAEHLIMELAGSADAAIFCDFGYGVVSDALLRKVMSPLRQRVKIITADVSGSRANLLGFKDVDLLCPTERELRATMHEYEAGLSTVAYKALEATQGRHLIATLGKRGLVAFARRSSEPSTPGWHERLKGEYLQALNSAPVDVLGCGDALLAGSTLALTSDANFIQAAYIGNALAAIEAGEVGNIPLDMRRLRAFLKSRVELDHSPQPALAGPSDFHAAKL